MGRGAWHVTSPWALQVLRTDMGFPEHVRILAARLYKKHNFNAAEAGRELTSLVEGEGPADAAHFCKRWWSHFQEHRHGKDKPRTGRPKKVPDSIASEIAKKIVGNPSLDRPPTYYHNLNHFLRLNPDVGQRVLALKVHRRTVERSILRADPTIVRRRPGRKKLLNAQQKQARLDVATRLSRVPKYVLRSIVFADEATLELKRAGKPRVYAQRGVELPPEQLEHAEDRAVWRVHYLAGVMEGAGSVGIYRLTGTSGRPKTYPVSNPLKS